MHLPRLVRRQWREVLLLCMLISVAALPIHAAKLNGPEARGVSTITRFSGGPDPADSRAMDLRATKIRAAKVRAATIRAAKVRAIYLPPAALTDRREKAVIASKISPNHTAPAELRGYLEVALPARPRRRKSAAEMAYSTTSPSAPVRPVSTLLTLR